MLRLSFLKLNTFYCTNVAFELYTLIIDHLPTTVLKDNKVIKVSELTFFFTLDFHHKSAFFINASNTNFIFDKQEWKC